MTEATEQVEKTNEELRQERIAELTQEREQLLAAEEQLREEKARLERTREEALDADDQEILQAALSNKPLKKSSSLRKAMDRLDELPHQLYAIKRRYLQVSIELGELEQEVLTEQRTEASKAAYAAQEALLKAEEERNFTQSIAAGAAADLQEKIRHTGRLRDQLEQHESQKPTADRIEAELARRKVWRGP